MQMAMNIKQFTYEIFDTMASAGSFVADSIKSKTKQDTTEPLPEVQQELAPPPAPTFSAEEVELAKNLAREEGVSQGYDNAKAQFEQQQAEIGRAHV